jgi:hypothetical protein
MGNGVASIAMKKAALVAEIESTSQDIKAAEHDLDRVLREIQVAPRAEKTTITEVVEKAFVTLRAARERLTRLEQSLLAEADD